MQADSAELEKMKTELEGHKLEKLVLEQVMSRLTNQLEVFDEFLEKKDEAMQTLIKDKEEAIDSSKKLKAAVKEKDEKISQLQNSFQIALNEINDLQQSLGEQKYSLFVHRDIQTNLIRNGKVKEILLAKFFCKWQEAEERAQLQSEEVDSVISKTEGLGETLANTERALEAE